MVSSATARRRLFALGLAVALVASLGLAAPASATPANEPFRLNFYRQGDFVSQTNGVQCVGASMQMMINMMAGKDNRTAGWQLELQVLARRYSARNWDGTEANGQVRQRRGASVRGWAFGLSRLGYGPYRVTAGETIHEAVRMAAVAMRQTGRPVGLLVWRGRHAWVMSGFEATGDPLMDPSAEITHVYVQDPLYPRISSTWGRSPKPNAKLNLNQLGASFVPRRGSANFGTGSFNSGSTSGRWTIVMPIPEMRPVDRRLNGLT